MEDDTLNLDKRRGPSDFRNMMEVRLRRSASTYSEEQQRTALLEMRRLIAARLLALGSDEEDEG